MEMDSEVDGYEEFCTNCILPDTGGLSGFEKLVDLENVGLVIYRRSRISKIKTQDKNVRIMSANKTVIIHNTRDKEITSEAFLQEMQTRKMTCPRCKQIIELASKLLQKVPAINKKAVMGICDHCKQKDPCLNCKETTKSFVNMYAAQAKKEHVTEKLSMIDYVNMDPFLDKKDRNSPTRSGSELRIEKLLQREYAEAERELFISDLCRRSLTPRSTKSLPVLGKYKKRLRVKPVDRTLTFKPSSDSKKTAVLDGKNIFKRDEPILLDFDENVGKSTASPSTTRDNYKTQHMPKQILKDYTSVLPSSKENLDIGSIITADADDIFLKETRPALKQQKSKYYKDIDIFPEHPKQYAHEKEKYGQKEIDDQYLETEVKKYDKDKTKSVQIPTNETSELIGKFLTKQKGIKRAPTFDETEDTQKAFTFSFYQEKPKPEIDHAGHKTSMQLIQETQEMLQDKTEEIKRRLIQNRLQKEEEQERIRLAEEENARLIAEKKAEAERTKKIREEVQLMKKIELDLTEAQKNEHRKSSIDFKLTNIIKSTIKSKDLKSDPNREKTLLSQNKQTTKPTTTKPTTTKLEPKKSKPEKEENKKEPEDKKEIDAKRLGDKTSTDLKNKSPEELKNKSPKELKKQITQELENKKTQEMEHEKSQALENKNIQDSGKTKMKDQGNKSVMEKFKEPENKSLKQKFNELENKKQLDLEKNRNNTKSDNEKEKESVKTRDKTLFAKPKGTEKKQLTDEKEYLNKEDKKQNKSDEKQNKSDKKQNKSDKKKKPFGNGNKGIQTLKETQEFVLDDIFKEKKEPKHQGIKQLARMQKEDSTESTKQPMSSKLNTSTKSKKNLKNEQGNKSVEKNTFRTPNKEVIMEFKESAVGTRYTYKGKTLRTHMEAHEKFHTVLKDPNCPFCVCSDLELNVDLRRQQNVSTECIKGEAIVNINSLNESGEHGKEPMLFHTNYDVPIFDIGDKDIQYDSKTELLKHAPSKLGSPKSADKALNTASGVTRYVLSDRTFIEKGWTVLPTEKVMRKMNVYRMRPAKPEFDWFKRNKNKHEMFYDSGERFVENQDDGRSRWYYKNQRLAMDYYDAAELNAQQRFVIYSNGEPDERGRARPYTVLAMFDHLGNGVVFDHGGKIRLKYNQTEGVVLDRSIGPVSHWKWHTLNDPPVLQQVMIDTQLAHKDPKIIKMGEREETSVREKQDEDMIAIEFDNFVKEKSEKLSQNFKPFQIKMKALKINENFSLKVLDQANVYLIYRDGTKNIKVNIGMLLDHKEIIDTDTAEVGDVANSLERLPARTDSLAAMQKTIAYAQYFEKTRAERDRRLRLPEPSISADKLGAAASRPMRPPLCAYNPSSTTTQSTRSFKRSLLNFNNLYYSTT